MSTRLIGFLLGLCLVGLSPLVWAQMEGKGVVSIPVLNPGAPAEPPGPSSQSPVSTPNIRVTGPSDNTQSEISMAASGSSIVISFNDFSGNGVGYVTSTDGGQTFTAKTSPPTPPGSAPCCDPALVADLLERFYLVQIFFNDGAGNCTNSLHVSTNGGVTFSNIVGSPFSFASGTTDFPDQPHMGIDRVNLVNGQPQLYVFTRHFTSGINCPKTGGSGSVRGELVCSVNGGAAWTPPFVFPTFTDLAHIGTAPDGRVYVVGNSTGTQANTTKIVLWRSTTTGCPAPAALSFTGPTTVADNLTFGNVGIDRENSQPYVVVDQLDSNRVYVAWSSDRLTNNGDRDIFLARCDFVGTAGSCGAPVRVNDNPIGDGTAQYFPMLCIDPNNLIHLSWNDRRSGPVQIFNTNVTTPDLSTGLSSLVSEVSFTPFDFPGSPDYGDYNENNQACDASHLYVAWSSQVSPPEISPPSTDVDVFFAAVKTTKAVVEVPVDIQPQSCPNPLNVRSRGVLPAAILGTATFDVTEVDVATLQLEGVPPLRSALEDVATPFEPFIGKKTATDCTTEGPDGFLDLTLKFDTQAVVAALGTVTDGEVLVLKLTGQLFDGTPIVGEDVVVILK